MLFVFDVSQDGATCDHTSLWRHKLGLGVLFLDFIFLLLIIS